MEDGRRYGRADRREAAARPPHCRAQAAADPQGLGRGTRAMSETPRKDESESLPLPLAQFVDQVCDRFESAWTAGRRPRIEDYLGAAAEPARRALLQERILIDVYYRRRACEDPQPTEATGRSPAPGGGGLAWTPAAVPAALLPPFYLRATPRAQGEPSCDTGATLFRCPHCHNPIQSADDHPDEVLCP